MAMTYEEFVAHHRFPCCRRSDLERQATETGENINQLIIAMSNQHITTVQWA